MIKRLLNEMIDGWPLIGMLMLAFALVGILAIICVKGFDAETAKFEACIKAGNEPAQCATATLCAR